MNSPIHFFSFDVVSLHVKTVKLAQQRLFKVENREGKMRIIIVSVVSLHQAHYFTTLSNFYHVQTISFVFRHCIILSEAHTVKR